jgi:hypothetical protein
MDRRLLIPVLALTASPLFADEAEDAFVKANILGIFYHEMGHALIDVLQMPVFGQEEDAADVASILLIDLLFEPEFALGMAYDVANGFWAEAQMNAEYETPYWDVHGPDAQRFYNTVCLFYGGDPETREDFAQDMELPPERAEYCPDEYALAADSWGAVFDDLTPPGEAMVFVAEEGETFTALLIADEVAALNEDFALPEKIEVYTASCGEANAYYDPAEHDIIMCEEFEGHLRELYRLLNN